MFLTITVYPEIMPIEEIISRPLNPTSYQQLCRDLFLDLGELQKTWLHVNNVMVLMQKYGSFIPYETVPIPENESRDIKLPDVSVYDLCKVAAAIASCLYCYALVQNDVSVQQAILKGEGTGEYLFVAGDFSGVQDFIYTISSRGALKSLRARSFFLELLATHITHRIVHEIGLTPVNILYSGGGRFAILAPVLKGVKDDLSKVREEFNHYLAEEHGAQLYLVVEWAEESKEHLTDSDFGGDTTGLRKKLQVPLGQVEAAKKERFGYLFSSDTSAFLRLLGPFYPQPKTYERQPQGTWAQDCILCHGGRGHIRAVIETVTPLGGSVIYKVDGCEQCLSEEKWKQWEEGKHQGECRVCRAETVFLFDLPEPQRGAERVPVCWLCHTLYHMGEHLPMKENRYLLRMKEYRLSKAMVTIEQQYYYLTQVKEAESALQNGQVEEAWLINSTDPKEYCSPNLWPLFVARHQPWHYENGRQMPLDFHYLAEWAVGASRLGVLRMDVDNMKDLFQDGLLAGSAGWFINRQ
jgi:CRISPR/Cas system-associated protein Cas10 (large subunit of type III CRISPR-Cas system)